MVYQALYRTYRPRKFSEMVGQEHIVRTLLNSIGQGKTGHAYLFSGPRGTGKTTVARILARAINCEHPSDGEPCDNCPRCKGTDEGLGVIEIDAASHGSVDDMRQLVAQVSQVPFGGGMMVYIIDEVHMLSKEAFNAFLKTLEEPPPHAVFVLATTEPGKLLATIHSRCQHFAFRRLPIDLVAEHIGWICREEKAPAEDSALKLIARAGDGSVRDSISILEQAIAFEPDGLTLKGVRDVLGIPDRLDIRRLAGHVIAVDPGSVSTAFASLIESGREPKSILIELLMHFRDLLISALNLEQSELDLLPDEERELIKSQAEGLRIGDIHSAITFLAKSESEIRWEDEAALLLEVSLLRLASGFGRESRAEEREARRTESQTSKPHIVMFPAAGEKPVEAPLKKEPARPPGRTSLTGGVSLKRKKKPEEKPVNGAVADTKPGVEEAPKQVDDSTILRIPGDIEPFWRNALESVREMSVTEYVLLAEATPSPSPSEWPEVEGDSPAPLLLTLRYPADRALIVRLLNRQATLNRLTAGLETALERPVELRIVHERSSTDSAGPDREQKQTGMHDGEGAVPGVQAANGPALFRGATRPAPKDPKLNQIHNLIVQDFPDYTVDYNGPVG